MAIGTVAACDLQQTGDDDLEIVVKRPPSTVARMLPAEKPVGAAIVQSGVPVCGTSRAKRRLMPVPRSATNSSPAVDVA